MSRLPGLGVAQSLVALAFLAAVVVVGAASLGLLGNGPAGASPSPTAIAVVPTPTDSPTSTTPADASPTPSPDSMSTPTPSGDVVAYTNPDGISPGGFAGDDYPFIETAHGLPTYAGLWADGNGRDFHVAVTADISGAIEALKAGIPRGITVYFHIAEYTEAEICAIRDAMFEDREELMRHGIILSYGGCGNREMRVQVGMSPFTPEAVAYMQARYQGPVDYEDGGVSALRFYEPVSVEDLRLLAVRSGDSPELLTCGGRPFPASGLAALTGAETDTGPEYDALREALAIYDEIYADLGSVSWQVAERDVYGATFLARRGDGWLHAPVFAGTTDWVPGVVGDCSPSPVTLSSAGNADWWLDPDYPTPKSASTELHVLINETGCAGASSPESRLLPPIVEYGANAVRIAVNVRGVGGIATCPGNPALPATIVLPEPIGDRTLEGGSPAVP